MFLYGRTKEIFALPIMNSLNKELEYQLTNINNNLINVGPYSIANEIQIFQ